MMAVFMLRGRVGMASILRMKLSNEPESLKQLERPINRHSTQAGMVCLAPGKNGRRGCLALHLINCFDDRPARPRI